MKFIQTHTDNTAPETVIEPVVIVDTPETVKDVTPEASGAGKPKRGRKTGWRKDTGNTEKPAPTNTFKEVDPDEELRKINEQFKDVKTGETVVTSSNPIEPAKVSMISGYMLLLVCDLFFPMVLMMLFKGQLKGKTKADLKLTKDERKELEPIANECAKELSVSMSATQIFVVSMFLTYASKLD